ncbi:MAG: lipoate--protein ligase family protein [Betaproteobacteria bacterium]|nr:lipoate--protein ligase family protein [Betaproteobacteria bacterium]
MADNWRIIDTGLRPAAQNIALSRALLEARRAEEIPSTLRFLRFAPSALLGPRQSAEQELDIDYCRAHDIALQRHIAGGCATYAEETQLGWELYLHRRDLGAIGVEAISRRLCHAAATAISALGVNAHYRPRDEIEVDGRRLASTDIAFDGNALLFQGTLLIDWDVEKMLRVLRMPAGRPFDTAVAMARERVTSLTALLGRQPDVALLKHYLTEAYESEFGIEFREADLTLSEHVHYQIALREIDTADWVGLVARPVSEMPVLEAAQKFAGGLLRATVTFETTTQTIRQVWFTGDLVVNPRRTVADLETALRDLPLHRLAQKVEWFLASRLVDIGALTPDDFVTVVRRAVGRPLLAQSS